MSCGVGCRCATDLMWLWLWLWDRLAAAALIRPLAWELPYAVVVALKTNKDTNKSLQMINAGEGVEKREPSYTVGGNVHWCNQYGKQYGDSSKN